MMLRNKSCSASSNVNNINHHTSQQQQRQSPSSARIPARRITCCCRSSTKKYRIIGIIIMAVLAFLFAYSYFYSWLNTTDPCLVAALNSPEKIAQFQTRGTNIKGPSLEYYAPLPKIIHQQWKTAEIPKGKYTEWRQAWLDLYPSPEYEHILWTDESMRQLIASLYPEFLPIYDAYPYNIQRADVARYFILHRFGGLYADLDYEPLINFWHRIPSDRVSLIESPYKYNEQHQNSLMASPQGDSFWNAVLDALVQGGGSTSNSSYSSSSSVFAKTGPQFLDRVARRKGGQPFYTLPCENFHRVPFVQESGKESPWITRLGHHTLARVYPMKYCGDFSQESSSSSCQYGKHHNAVSYLQETGGLT